LTSFRGSAISLSKSISGNERYRLWVSGSLNINSNDGHSNNFNADTVRSHDYTESSGGTQFLSVSFQYLRFLMKEEKISFYYGIGPSISTSWQTTTTEYSYGYASSSQYIVRKDESSDNSYSFGAIGSVGIEWSFTKRMSLHAEYSASTYYRWGKTKFTSTTRSEITDYIPSRSESSRTLSSWSLAGQGVYFGLSVNF